MRQTGVSVPDELFQYIEEYRVRANENGNTTATGRSEAMRELLELGRAASEIIEEEGSDTLNLDHGEQRTRWVRQACFSQLQAERRE